LNPAYFTEAFSRFFNWICAGNLKPCKTSIIVNQINSMHEKNRLSDQRWLKNLFKH